MKAIDLFAGWGGTTTGAEQAGVHVVWAANHSPVAVRVHEMNHPHVAHACQDLRQADWSTLPVRERDFILLASPACQGQSQCAQPARAASEQVRMKHDALRATAWAVVDCAEVTRPRAIVVENVREFRAWQLYPVWRAALETLGYTLSENWVVAADHGVPQLRERLFVVGLLEGRRLSMPLRLRPRPSFGPCIDWSEGEWRPVAEASEGARERILAGRRHGRRYLVQHVTGHRGVSLEEPIRTITTKDQWAVVDGERYRPLTMREYARAMGFPDSYAWPEGLARHEMVQGLGNAVPPPVARDVVLAACEAAA